MKYAELMIFAGSLEFVLYLYINERSTKSISQSNFKQLFIDCAKFLKRYQNIKKKYRAEWKA